MDFYIGQILEVDGEYMRIVYDTYESKHPYGTVIYPRTKWIPCLSKSEEKALDESLDEMIEKQLANWNRKIDEYIANKNKRGN